MLKNVFDFAHFRAIKELDLRRRFLSSTKSCVRVIRLQETGTKCVVKFSIQHGLREVQAKRDWGCGSWT